jgi:hypothetical protein
VPLVLDGDCSRQETGATFLKRLAAHFANETTVATPNGKVLSANLDEGLRKWQALPETERKQLDSLGKHDPARDPAPPAGGLILKVFARGLTPSGDGWEIYRNPKAHLSREPGRDHCWFTEAEWKSLVPEKPAVGEQAPVPAAITDRLCRRYLIDLVRIGGEGGPRRPENVVSQELTLTVEAADAREIRLRLDGLARFRTSGPEFGVTDKKGRLDEFRVLGFLRYDREKKSFTRFDAVALCPTGHHDEHGPKTTALGVAFTLTPGSAPADRVRPHSFHDRYFESRR